MTHSEWIDSPLGAGMTTAPVGPRYTISEACRHIDELDARCEWWLREYSILAEQLDELRDSRERLRIRVSDLEGLRDTQFDELRTTHAEILRLEEALNIMAAERDLARATIAKAAARQRGW